MPQALPVNASCARVRLRDPALPRDTTRAPLKTGAPVALRTPLYQAHLDANARMVEFAGWDMPVQYKGVLEEHQAVREACGLFDVSHMGEVLVTGPRALEALQHLVTNDLSKCKDGQAQYSALCDERGFVIDDIIVYRFSAERLFVCVNATGREKDFAWMQEHAIPGARCEQQSDAWAQIAVQGPKAAALVDSLCAPHVLELGNYHFKPASVAGIEGCIVARTGYTGEDGYEIFCPPERARELWGSPAPRREERGRGPLRPGRAR